MKRENLECCETDLDLAAIIRMLWKRRMFIIGCPMIFTIFFGAALFFIIPKMYEATRLINNVDLSIDKFLKMQTSINSNEIKNALAVRIPLIAQGLPRDFGKAITILSYPALAALETMETPGKIDILYVKTKYNDAEKALLLNQDISNILLENSIYNDVLLAFNSDLFKLQEKILSDLKDQQALSKDILMYENKVKALKAIRGSDIPLLDRQGVMLQFDVGREYQYLPIEMQINMFESVVIDKKTHIERLKIYNLWDEKVFEAINDLLTNMTEDFEIKKFFNLLNQKIEESDSEHVKVVLFNYYQRFHARYYNWKHNCVIAPSVLARGIKAKIRFAFVGSLFFSVIYVLLSGAMCDPDHKGTRSA